ncbi:MAG: glycosyltransferase family 2 protein [Oscillospiraceae bacterium]|nr:glycosyltransferase family 2 protein [Oscillospiraceae bacterium]
MNNSNVRILLAAYNGEKFLAEQLDSLLQQDYPHIQIIVSDDGSSDATSSILDRYAATYPDKITHYRSGQRFGSAQRHFMHLLNAFHDAPYIMFCDQDDVWHPDKVSKTLHLMHQTENGSTPCLVHTDLRVVNGQLEPIADSFCAHSGLDGHRLAPNQLLVQNVVTGCTVMVNRPLAELACRETSTEDMLMHDWWLALLASCCGNIRFLEEATIDYRQHGSNAVGAKNVHSPAYLLNRLRSNSMRRALSKTATQAKAFRDIYCDQLSRPQLELLDAFIATKDANIFKRDYLYLKHRLIKSGLIRKFAQLLGL